jgi:hypothetical protein
MITFTFDDGYTSTFRNAAPILHEFGMTATVGAICNRVFWQNTPQFMGVDELRHLVTEGWEVASHSLFHRRLPLLPPSYADEATEWRYDRAIDAFVADCPWQDVGTVVCGGKYLRRAPSLLHLQEMSAGFTHEPRRNRIYARTGDNSQMNGELLFGSAEREIAESRRPFEENGFEINAFIVPYSMWPDYLHPLASRYYPIVATVRGRSNILGSVSPDSLSRISVNKDRPVREIIGRVEGQLLSNSWSIICFHEIVPEISGTYDWKISQFAELVRWVFSQKTKVCTLSSGVQCLPARNN